MTRNVVKPTVPGDARTYAKKTDPTRPKPKKDMNGWTDAQKQRYQDQLDNAERTLRGRHRAKVRSQNPTVQLPPICGAPLDKVKRPARPDKEENLTPRLIVLYGLKDTYLTTCTAYAGKGTDHEGNGYCRLCEERTKFKMTSAKYSNGKSSNRPTKAQRGMTPAALRKFHGQVMRNRDILGQKLDIGPHEALLEEVQRTAGIVAWMEQLIRDLDEANQRATPDQEVSELAVITQFSKLGMEPSAVYQIYQWEREHLVSSARAAIACGVAERRVKLAEEQGRMLVMVIQAFVYDPMLALSPAQLQAAPSLIRKHMLAIRTVENPDGYIDAVATGNTPRTTTIDVEAAVRLDGSDDGDQSTTH